MNNVQILANAKFTGKEKRKAKKLVQEVGFFLETDEQSLKKARQSMRLTNAPRITVVERKKIAEAEDYNFNKYKEGGLPGEKSESSVETEQ